SVDMSRPVTFQLAEADQQILLRIARNAVHDYLSGQAPAAPTIPPGPLTQIRGIFVSLHHGLELRGCIGNIYAVSPLYRSAAECAIAAAVGDPRFMPLTAAELADVEFEISVLSPFERVRNIDEIQIGLHGLMITKDNLRG